MTTNQKASLAIVAGTLCGFVTMSLHPTGHDVVQNLAGGGKGSLNVLVHSLALFGQALLLTGSLALTLRFRKERSTAVAAYIFFAWASVAIMIAATASGFISGAMLKASVSQQGAARDFAQSALHYTAVWNQSFTKLFVAFSSLAIIIWSAAMLREKILSRSLGIYGLVSGLAALALTLSGTMKFNIHGFGAIVLAQAIWFIWMASRLRNSDTLPAS